MTQRRRKPSQQQRDFAARVLRGSAVQAVVEATENTDCQSRVIEALGRLADQIEWGDNDGG